MGLNAYLTVIAKSEYRKYPRVNPTGLVQFDLNKGWVPLDLALRTMPTPLDLALRGDRPSRTSRTTGTPTMRSSRWPWSAESTSPWRPCPTTS